MNRIGREQSKKAAAVRSFERTRSRPGFLTGIVLVLWLGCWDFTQAQSAANASGETREQPIVGSMIDIPAATFMMGSNLYPTARAYPAHAVTVPAFRLAMHEVTRGQFAAFVQATGYRTVAERGGGCWANLHRSALYRSRMSSFREPGFHQENTHPVVCVSWGDAQAYTKWLSDQTGRKFRLPTEAEWERAVRVDTTFSFGDEPSRLCKIANVGDQSLIRQVTYENLQRAYELKRPIAGCNDGWVFTAPVGSFVADPPGLFDMFGNVSEWVADCYATSYDGAPVDGSARATCDTNRRVIRGGSWLAGPAQEDSFAERGKAESAFATISVGFRLAEDALDKRNIESYEENEEKKRSRKE